jgi:hypothetical protein
MFSQQAIEQYHRQDFCIYRGFLEPAELTACSVNSKRYARRLLFPVTTPHGWRWSRIRIQVGRGFGVSMNPVPIMSGFERSPIQTGCWMVSNSCWDLT